MIPSHTHSRDAHQPPTCAAQAHTAHTMDVPCPSPPFASAHSPPHTHPASDQTCIHICTHALWARTMSSTGARSVSFSPSGLMRAWMRTPQSLVTTSRRMPGKQRPIKGSTDTGSCDLQRVGRNTHTGTHNHRHTKCGRLSYRVAMLQRGGGFHILRMHQRGMMASETGRLRHMAAMPAPHGAAQRMSA